MTRCLIFLTLFFLTNCQKSKGPVFSVLHYNIKELDSKKLESNNEQLKALANIFKELKGDIISINEIQYDLPGVPTSKFQSKGKNLTKFAKLLNLSNFNQIFEPANTGINARKLHGQYIAENSHPKAREYADPINFGIFPSQYSTGGLIKFEILSKKVITKLKWKDFNPKRDLTLFKANNGEDLPKNMELFDKNFTDTVLNIEGVKVHLILLHTVPAYHFGNMKSVNYVRNEDQLRFLEWYLTGSTDITVDRSKLNVKPINKDATYIAMGDLNVDIRSTDPQLKGAIVLRRVLKKSKLWVKEFKDTYLGSSFIPEGFSAGWDYIIVSSNIEILKGDIYQPESKRKDLPCFETQKTNLSQTINGKRLVSYTKKEKGKTLYCYSYVSKEYYDLKMGSDHLPIFGQFKITE